MNLIPNKPSNTPSYYCTWEAQNNIEKTDRESDYAAFEGDQGAQMARASLNDDILFGKNGLALQYEKVRGDLYFILDDGWDVPYNVHPATDMYEFGSLLLNEERFPSCTGEPWERLAKMNERIKALGWKGLGLWLAAQAQGEREGKLLSKEQSIAYYTERLKWCRQANIDYWKVDWGFHCHSVEYRKMLTDLGKEVYPELYIEHCRCMRPTNENAGRFDNWEDITDKSLDIFEFSDIFRSYDVTIPLSVVTTLDRLSVLLQKQVSKNALGIINCEDELYIGAALGCSLGVMRTKLNKSHRNMDEVIRAVNWQRIAPAFGAGKSNISNEIGIDTWHFKPGDTWAAELIGTELKQGAPIAMARGLNLPRLDKPNGEAPFVVAAKNPNGAISIATLRRASLDGIKTPECSIHLEVGDTEHPIGIFGYYGQLNLYFDRPISAMKIYAQDLAGDVARDITDLLTVNDNRLIIPGGLIAELGLSSASEGDNSEPGLVLALDSNF